uniref:Uncharacterized protein n=1 Tax=Zea mays TaxID=4577 RepID=G2XK59_MAIZE|nr:hypothetical protein rf1-C2-g14 [Zea mays]
MIMSFHIELLPEGVKIQTEVVTEEESTPVAADQVEEPSNWGLIEGSSTSSLQQRQTFIHLSLVKCTSLEVSNIVYKNTRCNQSLLIFNLVLKY